MARFFGYLVVIGYMALLVVIGYMVVIGYLVVIGYMVVIRCTDWKWQTFHKFQTNFITQGCMESPSEEETSNRQDLNEGRYEDLSS